METSNLQEFVFNDQNLPIVFVVLMALCVIRILINSFLINNRDNTNHFVFLLNPFSETAWQHGGESMLRFYWSLDNNLRRTKKLANFLNIAFVVGFVILSVLGSILEK
jgi:hypothetical protein